MTEGGDNGMTKGLSSNIENRWHCHFPSICPGGGFVMGDPPECCRSCVDVGSHGASHGDLAW